MPLRLNFPSVQVVFVFGADMLYTPAKYFIALLKFSISNRISPVSRSLFRSP
jgi:hypothetical protein